MWSLDWINVFFFFKSSPFAFGLIFRALHISCQPKWGVCGSLLVSNCQQLADPPLPPSSLSLPSKMLPLPVYAVLKEGKLFGNRLSIQIQGTRGGRGPSALRAWTQEKLVLELPATCTLQLTQFTLQLAHCTILTEHCIVFTAHFLVFTAHYCTHTTHYSTKQCGVLRQICLARGAIAMHLALHLHFLHPARSPVTASCRLDTILSFAHFARKLNVWSTRVPTFHADALFKWFIFWLIMYEIWEI